MDRVYIPYKLAGKVIDWKEKWFYIGNHGNTLPVITPEPPTVRPEWKQEPVDDSKIQDLLGWIADLKHDKISGAAVVMDWIKHMIQPLQASENFCFEYQGASDPSATEISNGKALCCVQRVLEKVDHVPHMPNSLSVLNPPRQIVKSSRFIFWVLLLCGCSVSNICSF